MTILLPLLAVIAGIAGRALTDKLLVVRGGPDAVAAYAQLANLGELVANVSLAGIGVALVAVVARAEPGHRVAWLRASLAPCLILSGAVALCILPVLAAASGRVVPKGMEGQALLAVAVGWLAVAPTLVMSCLIGMGRPGLAAAWTAASFLPPLAVLAVHPFSAPADVLLGQGLFGLVATIGILWQRGAPVDREEIRGLIRFAPAGIAIGILSPVAMLLARTRIAEVAGWELAAQAQAVWRVNEWVQATAAGLLYVHFLPKFSAAGGGKLLGRELRRAAVAVLVPAALATGSICLALPELVTVLYRADMAPPPGQAVLILAGDWIRLVAWIFLYGLYARQAAQAVAIGELLSLPLFALLLWFSIRPDDLASVGLAWAMAYLAYALFNGLALREVVSRRRGEDVRIGGETS